MNLKWPMGHFWLRCGFAMADLCGPDLARYVGLMTRNVAVWAKPGPTLFYTKPITRPQRVCACALTSHSRACSTADGPCSNRSRWARSNTRRTWRRSRARSARSRAAGSGRRWEPRSPRTPLPRACTPDLNMQDTYKNTEYIFFLKYCWHEPISPQHITTPSFRLWLISPQAEGKWSIFNNGITQSSTCAGRKQLIAVYLI